MNDAHMLAEIFRFQKR